MKPSWKSVGLLFVLVVALLGCGRKPKEPTEADSASAAKLKSERPAQSNPPTPKVPGPEQPTPKAPSAKPVEAIYDGDVFADVRVGDGVALRATCVGWENGRVLLF